MRKIQQSEWQEIQMFLMKEFQKAGHVPSQCFFMADKISDMLATPDTTDSDKLGKHIDTVIRGLQLIKEKYQK